MKLYLMLKLAAPYRVKIGISDDTKRRAGEVGAMPIFSGTIWGAYAIEQTLHMLLRPLRSKQRGSGKTEWFWFLNPAFAYASIFYGWDWRLVLFAPLPLDLLAICTALWILQRVAVVAVLLGFAWFYSKLSFG